MKESQKTGWKHKWTEIQTYGNRAEWAEITHMLPSLISLWEKTKAQFCKIAYIFHLYPMFKNTHMCSPIHRENPQHIQDQTVLLRVNNGYTSPDTFTHICTGKGQRQEISPT